MVCHRQVCKASAAREGCASAFSVRSWHRMRRIMRRAAAANVERTEESFPGLWFVEQVLGLLKKFAQRLAGGKAVVSGDLFAGLAGSLSTMLGVGETPLDDLD